MQAHPMQLKDSGAIPGAKLDKCKLQELQREDVRPTRSSIKYVSSSGNHSSSVAHMEGKNATRVSIEDALAQSFM